MSEYLTASARRRKYPVLVWLSRNRTILASVLSALVFIVVAVAISKITRDIRYDSVIAALNQTPVSHLLMAIGFTFVSFGFLILYDVNALRSIGHPLPPAPVALISFSAYAVGNTAGFGPLSGGAIRYRGYTRLGLSGAEVAHVVAFVTLAFGIGLMVLTGLSVFAFSNQIAGVVGYSPFMLRSGACALFVILGGAVIWAWRHRPAATSDDAVSGLAFRMPHPGVVGTQIMVTAGDVMAAASVLYVLLPAGVPLDWAAFVALFCVAVGLGVLSHVPAGLGVFETVIIGGLGPAMPIESVIGALVIYRVVYHILPLALAVIALSATEFLRHWHTIASVWSGQVTNAVLPPLLAVIALVCATMLIFSAVVPTPPESLDWLGNWLPLQVIETTHFISSLLGLVLFVAARGLVQRSDGAFWVSLFTAVAALIFTTTKSYAPYEAATLLFLLCGLLLGRRCFNRPARLMAEPLTPAWLAALAIIILAALMILFFVDRDVTYSSELWWQFELSEEAPRGLRALLGTAIIASAIGILSLLRPAVSHIPPPSEAELARAVAICRRQNDSGANLVRMGDKALMFAANDAAFIMYGTQGRSWISLYGPIGDRDAKAELSWRFAEAARGAGAQPVFYQVPPALLPAFADIGLRALKLGEVAVVDLQQMDYTQSRWGEQRRAVARGLRDGLRLDILAPDDVRGVVDELGAVSASWLQQHATREKGFALGRFDPAYICTQSVAVLRSNDQVVAFATLMQTDTMEEISIDLMRFSATAPKGAMDFLFSAMLAEAKAMGYRHFNLGMAPLSGFSVHESAPLWNHIGQVIFTHGDRFYNFRGLRAFKAKFNPVWEPRYLVAGSGVSPVSALLDITLLIGGGIKGVVGK